MSPIDLLLWALAILAALIVLSVVAFLALLVYAATVGIRRMRDEDVKETEIYRGRGDR